MAQRRILVTGSDGLIGKLLIDAWRDSPTYEAVGLARKPGPYADVIGDIANFDAIRPYFDGVDAVVHMAASSAVGSTWEQVLPSNLIGAYNVFEAARQAGVEQVVFASSNHAIGTNETENQPELWEIDDPRIWDETAEIRPDSLYGVSKAFGEDIGRFYYDKWGLEFIALRIGWFLKEPYKEPGYGRAMWLSPRDCAQAFTRATEAEVPFGVFYAISNNPDHPWDLTDAVVKLGYRPQDTWADFYPVEPGVPTPNVH